MKVFTPEEAFFSIDQKPIFWSHQGGDLLEPIPNRQALINKNTQAVLGIVSDNYKPVLNQDVYNLFGEAFDGYKAKIAKEIHHLDVDGRKWSCDFVLKNDELEFNMDGKDDIVGILVRVFNAYDGKNAYGYEIMGFRWMCENGLIGGKQTFFLKSFRHFQNKVNELIEDFTPKFKNFEKNVELWSKWTNAEISPEKFENFVNEKEYVGERLKKKILDSYQSNITTMWQAYNHLTYIATHETASKKKSGIFTNKYNIMTRLVEDFYIIDYKLAA